MSHQSDIARVTAVSERQARGKCMQSGRRTIGAWQTGTAPNGEGMYEVEYEPLRSRFVQLLSRGRVLTALDDKGQIWELRRGKWKQVKT
jgi:hypothetical protein